MKAYPYTFLVDVNLPKYFSFFNNESFIHLVDINREWTDSSIWEYAKKHSMVILTRDTDFFFRCAVDPSVKVIHFNLGNIRLKELHAFFSTYWNTIVDKLEEATLIQVSRTHIQIILPDNTR